MRISVIGDNDTAKSLKANLRKQFNVVDSGADYCIHITESLTLDGILMDSIDCPMEAEILRSMRGLTASPIAIQTAGGNRSDRDVYITVSMKDEDKRAVEVGVFRGICKFFKTPHASTSWLKRLTTLFLLSSAMFGQSTVATYTDSSNRRITGGDFANNALRVNCVTGCSGGGGGNSNITGINGVAPSVGTGATDSGTLRVVLGATQPSLTVSVSNFPASQTVSGTVTANQGGAPWSVSQSGTWNIGTVTTLTGITNAVTVSQGTAANLLATVSQGGTWTVQPGNTANTTPWLTTISQGGNAASVTSANKLSVDDSVTDTTPATQNITTQDISSSTTTGANSQSIITGTPTANSAASFAISGLDSLKVQVTGTWTGTLQSEISLDGGSTWYINGIHQSGTAYTVATWTGNMAGGLNVSGVTNWRMRATAAMTGTATVKIVGTENVNSIYVANGLNLQDATVQSQKLSVTSRGSAYIEGPIASGASNTANPIKSGAPFNTTQPTVTNGQMVDLQATARGGLIVATGVDAFVVRNQDGAGNNLASSTTTPTGTEQALIVRNIPSGTQAVTVSSGVINVVGAAASGATNTGNPIKIGGAFNTTQPTVTNGQAVDLQATARGALIVSPGVDNFATQATLSAETTKVIGTVRTVGNVGGVLDAANNGAVPANILAVGFEQATQGTTQPTAGTAGNLRRAVISTDGALYVRQGGPVNFTCSADAIAASLTQLTGCAGAGASLKYYITDIIAQSTTSTAGQFLLRTGTGTNCGTGTASIFPSAASAVRYAAPANTVAPTQISFTTPLQTAANVQICVLGVATNTVTIQVNGYIAP